MSYATASPPERLSLAEARVAVFREQYGYEALDLAAHAAFPLTLTTELVYCLRENFLSQECPWYAAADVLLSGLCNPIGHDLYEMEGETRNYLLRYLTEVFGESRLDKLEEFMLAYIQQQIVIEKSERPRVLGDRPHWTALAYLRPNGSADTVRAIQQELQKLALADDPKERFRMAALVESYADLLSEAGFKPLLVQWAKQVAENQPINQQAAELTALTDAGFPLKPTEEVATISFEGDKSTDENELQPIEFETVVVRSDGQIIHGWLRQGWQFIEPLLKPSPPLEMVAIPGGGFLMGSTDDNAEAYNREKPQHQVTVAPFFMSKYPITQAQWMAIVRWAGEKTDLKVDPALFKGMNRPVERVSWYDAKKFCQLLSSYTGRKYRLPTEAEWEYACRAETTTAYCFGETLTSELANYEKNVGETTPVDQFYPNPFGLYDMHGNVYEWCLDHWHENYNGAPTDGTAWLTSDESLFRVLRGGSWIDFPWDCRSAFRYISIPDARIIYSGFRVMCEAQRT